MQASIKFYRDLLGFKIVHQGGTPDDISWVLLELDGIGLMLNAVCQKKDRPELVDNAKRSAHGDISFYFSSPDIEEIHIYLKKKGIPVNEPYLTGYGFVAMDFKDPDGYNINFHWPLEKAGNNQ